MRLRTPYVRRRARIEIVPLIDIVFFLLATFVMVSMSMIKNSGIPVNLPSATTAAPQERKDFTTLTVTEEGFLYMDKEKIALDELAGELQKRKASEPELRVFIHGDEKASFGATIQVLDTVRKTGITKVAIRTVAQSAAQDQTQTETKKS